MKADLKQSWLVALRSGRYEQGRSYLRSEDRFCCLGVLCDLVNPEAWQPSITYGSKIHDWVTNGSLHSSFPGRALLDDIGLDCDLACKLASWNDTGSSFEEIANKIEQEA